MIHIGVVGYGYWGPNLVRNLSNHPHCTVDMISDLRPDLLRGVQKLYPTIRTTTNPDEIFSSSLLDAVVIATPVATHYSLAKKTLLSGKHVLVEKPITTTVGEAAELIKLAEKLKKVLMVDHTFIYNPAVQVIKSFVENDLIGDIHYIDSIRINLGLFQHDVNVLWDLAVHDISIVNFLTKERPDWVQAIGASHTSNGVENIAFLILRYNSGMIAHLNCSWISPVKIRQMLIGGTRKMIVYDDLQMGEKVKIYDSGFQVRTDEDRRRMLVDYRAGDVHSPKVPHTEALSVMTSEFIDSILSGKEPISNGYAGLEVLKLLEAAQVSIKNRGKEILVK
jgi:predicted dehydrogenase